MPAPPGKAVSLAGTLKLTSGYQQIPATVTGLAFTAAGGVPLTFEPLPAEVPLAPGASAEVPVTVRVGASSGASAGAPSAAPASGASAAPDTSTVTLTGTVTSPWQTVLTQDLNLAFTPRVTATATAKVVGQPTPAAPAVPWPLVGGVAGGVAALALLALVALRLRGPSLVGSLAVSQNGRLVREFLLAGRSTPLDDPSTPGLSGTVTGLRTKDGAATIVLHPKGGQRAKVPLTDRQSAEVGDYTVTYTAQRTRMISMIQAGLDEGDA